ncbi:hypothetical protein [Nocardia nova]|uniref:hypothetical protein n=1 Tax=Nocardia nova TaxID=37330 RepID=UPI0034010A78
MRTMLTTVTNRALTRTHDGLQIRRTVDRIPMETSGFRRVLRVGICGTDLQIQRGARDDRAAVLGHEGIAERLDGPSDASGSCEIFNPVDPDDQDVILGHSVDGLLRDYIVGEIDSLRSVVPACSSLPLDLAPLVEPTATCLYAWELMRPQLGKGAPVAIFGAGSSALLLAMLGEDLGHRVYLVHPRSQRLRFIAQLGVLRTACLATSVPVDSMQAAVTCLPREAAQHAIEQATESLIDGGIINLFGGIPTSFQSPMIPHVDLSTVRRANICGRTRGSAHLEAVAATGKRVRLTGHRGTSPAHLHEAQRHLVDGASRYGRLITQVISLDEAAVRVPSMAGRRRIHGEHVKVVVDLTMACWTRSVDLYNTVAEHLALGGLDAVH